VFRVTDKTRYLLPTQVRKCREFADTISLIVLDEHIYIDGDGGVGSDRLAFQRLLNAALSLRRPFDTILADDTSRLSRSQSECLTVIEKLKFAGLRVIFVSQGIDTDSEQSDVQMTVHGLVDSLYVKELAKKTHRGLESCALRGVHTGGRCYGYSAVAVGEGESKRLVINKTEAVVVKEILELVRRWDIAQENSEISERKMRSVASLAIQQSWNVVPYGDQSYVEAGTLQG
jgi:site-specific DNA recombinase